MKAARGPSIVGWSVVSPIGIGGEAFTDALFAGTSGCKPLPSDYPAPVERAATIPEFETVAFLGRKGTRSMDRLTAMVIATAGMILQQQETIQDEERRAMGMVVGTSTGSLDSITGFIRDTFIHDRPYHVNPAAFPNTVMNCAAGQTAIWHGLHGLNSTVSGGHLTGLLALQYARRAIGHRYADTLLVGAVEEFSPPVAWADVKLRDARQRLSRPLGEGCAMFMIEDPAVAAARGRRVLAEVVDLEFQVDPDGGDGQRDALAACIRTVVERAGVDAGAIELVSVGRCGESAPDNRESAAIADALGPAHRSRRCEIANLVGNTFSASGAFQVAALLATTSRPPESSTRLGLITSLGSDGAVGCALLQS
jgi:3-oxoacyl-[acyl-carrier-protein] synthase II